MEHIVGDAGGQLLDGRFSLFLTCILLHLAQIVAAGDDEQSRIARHQGLSNPLDVVVIQTGVRMGRANLRYAGWVEFGGTRRVPHPSVRPYTPRGRYLFPAAVQLSATSARYYSQATAAAFERFRWTNSTSNPEGVHD